MEALAAGVGEKPFPIRAILEVTRERWPELRARRQVSALRRVTENESEHPRWRDRQQLADNNVSLLLSIAQDIPVDHPWPLDIDHIYAGALASRMHVTDNWRMHHPERWRVNTIGNLWLLDAGANRALQDQKPPIKFGSLEEWLSASPVTHRVWPKVQWSITGSEIERFKEVDAALDHDINGAMEKFSDLVQRRADRLLDTPFEMLPEARDFAQDAEFELPKKSPPADAASLKGLAERLGLAKVRKRFEKTSPGPSPDGRPGEPGERRHILEVPLRWGWPKGWKTEFARVDFRGETWEEHNVKTLYHRTFKWLWENCQEDLLRWNEAHDGPIAGPPDYGRWDRLDDEHYLQMGMFYGYLLEAVQEVLKALGLADEVYVVYAYPDE
jgi:hypothetical protein